MTDTGAPAGWYPAPHANNELRYWDGTRWLEGPANQSPASNRPLVDATSASSPGGAPSSEFAGAQPSYTNGARYPNASTTTTFAPSPSARSKGLAIAALCLGIAALLLCWIPWLGLLLAGAAVTIGIVGLVRKQPLGLALTGLVLGAVALIAALAITLAFTAFVAASPSESGSRSVPAVTTTPESSLPADVDAAQDPEPDEIPEPDSVTPDLTAFGTVDERTFALIVKDPDAYVGTDLIVFGEVSQLDAATGPCAMRLSAAESQKETSFEYSENTLAVSGDAETTCPIFDPLVKGDHVKMWVTVLGSVSYGTQIGGNTTVPAFQVWQAELLPAQEY